MGTLRAVGARRSARILVLYLAGSRSAGICGAAVLGGALRARAWSCSSGATASPPSARRSATRTEATTCSRPSTGRASSPRAGPDDRGLRGRGVRPGRDGRAHAAAEFLRTSDRRMTPLIAIAFRNLLRAKRRTLSGRTMVLGSAASVLGSGLSDGIAQLTNLAGVRADRTRARWWRDRSTSSAEQPLRRLQHGAPAPGGGAGDASESEGRDLGRGARGAVPLRTAAPPSRATAPAWPASSASTRARTRELRAALRARQARSCRRGRHRRCTSLRPWRASCGSLGATASPSWCRRRRAP